jgi:DNA invertase Pin-like site-specific DNA recombinase
MRIIGYIRVSTTEQGLSIEAQQKRLEMEAQLRGWSLKLMIDEGQSGAKKPSERPALCEALRMLAAGEAQGIAVTKLDRIARSVADVATLLDTARTEGWSLIALDLGIDTASHEGQLVAGIMASIAQWERARIRERIREALAITRDKGTRLGTPPRYDNSVAQRILELRECGMTWQQVGSELARDGIVTKAGKELTPATLRSILKRCAESPH